jgi:beta-lactam-binding protein with PASTA domain
VDPTISKDIDAVVGKALAKDPADRYQSAEEMAADIGRVLAGLPAHAGTPSEHSQATHISPVPVPSPVTEVSEEATHGLRGPVVPAAAGATAAGGPPFTEISPTAGTAVVAPADQTVVTGRSSAGRTVVVALLTLLVLAGLVFGAYRLLADRGSNSVTVPSVIGSTRPDAEQVLRDADLQPAFRNVSGPGDETVGKVIRQTPEEGAGVLSGSTVTAEINVGPATARIPKKLVGRQLDVVMEKLADAGFSNVVAVPVANPPAGTKTDEVLAVDPREGAKAAPKQDITVRYASRASRAPTRGTNQKPGAGQSSRPSDTESSDEAEQSEEPEKSDDPSAEASSDQPSDQPSDSTEPEPSVSESSVSAPSVSASASSGGAPSAEASGPPGGEEPPISIEPADAGGPGKKPKPKQDG